MTTILVGKWRASEQLPGDGSRPGMGWLKEYTFAADGTFVMTGYPPIEVRGRWAIPETDDHRIRIVLSARTMSGSPWPDLDRWAEIDTTGAQLRWDDATFTRV